MPLQLYIKYIKMFVQLTFEMFWNQNILMKIFFLVWV